MFQNSREEQSGRERLFIGRLRSVTYHDLAQS
jgi:hypothetical protein